MQMSYHPSHIVIIMITVGVVGVAEGSLYVLGTVRTTSFPFLSAI